MSDIICAECDKLLSIVYDKYYKITIEYDGSTKEVTTVVRVHRKCFKGGRFDI